MIMETLTHKLTNTKLLHQEKKRLYPFTSTKSTISKLPTFHFEKYGKNPRLRIWFVRTMPVRPLFTLKLETGSDFLKSMTKILYNWANKISQHYIANHYIAVGGSYCSVMVCRFYNDE